MSKIWTIILDILRRLNLVQKAKDKAHELASDEEVREKAVKVGWKLWRKFRK